MKSFSAFPYERLAPGTVKGLLAITGLVGVPLLAACGDASPADYGGTLVETSEIKLQSGQVIHTNPAEQTGEEDNSCATLKGENTIKALPSTWEIFRSPDGPWLAVPKNAFEGEASGRIADNCGDFGYVQIDTSDEKHITPISITGIDPKPQN